MFAPDSLRLVILKRSGFSLILRKSQNISFTWLEIHEYSVSFLLSNVEEPLNHQITNEMPRDLWRMTPLHIACQEGHHEVVMVLECHLSAEDIRAKDMEENTVLHLACEGGKKNIVQLLLDKGALNNVKNARGEAPIHLAARDGYKDIVKLLLEEDGIVDTLQDNGGFTPLHHAARNNQEKVIEFLCER